MNRCSFLGTNFLIVFCIDLLEPPMPSLLGSWHHCFKGRCRLDVQVYPARLGKVAPVETMVGIPFSATQLASQRMPTQGLTNAIRVHECRIPKPRKYKT